MNSLNEGLLEHDLDDLVVPIISIDEYDSKIDTDAIVVAFSAADQEPADDLSYFIETGGYDILDAEVSPAPDVGGNYLIFVEFARNNEFVSTLHEILDSLDTLTDIKEFTFTWHGGDDEELPATDENIKDKVRLDKKEEVTVSESGHKMYSFLKNSTLSDLRLKNNMVEFVRGKNTAIYEKVALGDPNLVFHLLKLDTTPLLLDSPSLHECKRLRSFIGEDWEVNKVGSFFIVDNGSPQVLVLKNIK